MSPVPPSSGKFPPQPGATQQGYFQVLNRNATAKDQFDVRGPYFCRRIPVGGNLQLPKNGTPQMVLIDERIFLPLESGATARSVLSEIRTGRRFTIAHVARWPDELEVYAVLVAPSQ
jgi:hypothetical protein